MLKVEDSIQASSNNTSSESDTTPSTSPSPARSIKSRFGASNKRETKKNKTVLVFIQSSKSKSSRSLFNITKNKKNKKNKNKKNKNKNKSDNNKLNITAVPSSPSPPKNRRYSSINTTTTSSIMANVNQLKEQFEKQRRSSYTNNNGNHLKRKIKNNHHFDTHLAHNNNNNLNLNAYKVNTEQFKRSYNKALPQKPYIVNDDDGHYATSRRQSSRNHNNGSHKESSPSSPVRHHKSKSHIGLSPTMMAQSNGYLNSHHLHHQNQNNNKDDDESTHKYTGTCPHCNHESPLLEFITASNRHSHLTELRDKLSAVETLANILKQQILEVQSRSNAMSGSDTNLNRHTISNDNRNNLNKKQVSNPFQQDVSSSSSYHLQNLNIQQQQALSLLTTQKKLTFPIKGTAMISPQENIGYFDKFKEMRRRFEKQEFFVGLDSERMTFTVHTKLKLKSSSNNNSNKSQYRQVRSFSSLNGAEFESAKDNVLKIWFKNTRGYCLMSFASETEANTVLNLINIIVNNDLYQQTVSNQLVWASYIDKKGKRMRLYSQKFLCLIKLEIKLYKTHINYTNGEEPSQRLNLMECDLIRNKNEIKFISKIKGDNDDGNNGKSETLLSIKLISEIERDDFLNLCAQTLGKAIQRNQNKDKDNAHNQQLANISAMLNNKQSIPMSPSNTMSYIVPATMSNNTEYATWNLAEREEESGTDDIDESFDEKSAEYNRVHNESIGGGYNAYNDDDDVVDDGNLLVYKSMTMTLRGAPTTMGNLKNNYLKNEKYLEQLNNTPRMYGAGLHKALDRLAKKRPSDIDFIETTFKGNEIVLKQSKSDETLKTYQLLDVLGKSMISGAFLNKNLFLHKPVWEQNKVMVINYEKKLETFNVILSALNILFNDINIDWLKSNFLSNSSPFHDKLIKCERALREAQSTLTDFINKSEQQQRQRGAARFLNKFKDKSRAKVFDNQPYRDLIYKICGHASSMQLYYIYLTKPMRNKQDDDRKMLLNDIRGITLCMDSFARVVIGDSREFLWAYLRRGAKNIYQ